MKAYQLKRIPERFMEAGIDVISLAEQLGSGSTDILRFLMYAPVENEPLTPVWKEGLATQFRPMSPTSTEIPDISIWEYGFGLLLNAKAYDVFKDFLAPEGEFLPITVDGEMMQIFNCLSYAKEDESRCVRCYIAGELATGLETLFFDEEDIAGRFLFKSKLQGGGVLYCSSSFKALCEEVGLKGLRFDEDLLSPF